MNFKKYLNWQCQYSPNHTYHPFLNNSRFVEQNYPRLAVLGVARVLKISEVHVGHPLVRLLHDADADVAVLFVLAVQCVAYDIVTSLYTRWSCVFVFVDAK